MSRLYTWVLSALLFPLVANTTLAEDHPEVVRIGAPAISGDQQVVWPPMAVARAQGLFEKEFAKDGIRFEFPGFKGGGPMVGQALANGQIDFAANGDMISIIGRSNGIKSRLIFASSRGSNAYLLVKPGSSIKSVEDLRGKKVAYPKGNYIQLQVIRILETKGMKESDFQNVNLRGPAAVNALNNGDIDAFFTGIDTMAAVERGLAQVAYSTQGESGKLTGQTALLVSEDFAEQYPEITERIVKVLTKAAHWASEPENREQAFQYWATSGQTVETLRSDYGDRLVARLSPLLDPFYLNYYQQTQKLIADLGLLRGGAFDTESWFDRSYLDQALKELHLEHYWTPVAADDSSPVAKAL